MKDTISKLKAQRHEMNNIIILSVILGILINMISGIISNIFEIESWINLIVLLFFCIVILIIMQFVKIQKLNTNIRFDCAFIVDEKNSNEIIDIPNYEISNDMYQYLKQASSENEVFKYIWGKEKFNIKRTVYTGKDGALMAEGSDNVNLLIELLEYCILEDFSTFIESYFNARHLLPKVITLSREDIPDILQQNRFLKLFSEPPENRSSFCKLYSNGIHKVDETGVKTIVTMYGENGEVFRRLDLSVPKGTKVYRENRNTIVIDTKLFVLKIKPLFGCFTTVIESDFYKYYIHKESNNNFHDWKFNIDIEVNYKTLSAFKVWDWKYYNWLDDYINRLENYCDINAFYDNIGWKKAKTIIRVNEAK